MKLVQYVIQIPDRKLKHCTITIKEFYDSLYIANILKEFI